MVTIASVNGQGGKLRIWLVNSILAGWILIELAVVAYIIVVTIQKA